MKKVFFNLQAININNKILIIVSNNIPKHTLITVVSGIIDFRKNIKNKTNYKKYKKN